MSNMHKVRRPLRTCNPSIRLVGYVIEENLVLGLDDVLARSGHAAMIGEVVQLLDQAGL